MRSHFLHTVLGLTAAGAMLVACGDDAADGGGGAGGASSAEAGTTTAVVGPATIAAQSATVTGSGVVSATQSTGGNPTVGPNSAATGQTCTTEVFVDETVNECGNVNCCEEMQLCESDFALCFDLVEGTLDESLPGGAALAECMSAAGCFGAGVCESGLAFSGGDAVEFAECLGDNCCDEFNFCTSNAEDVQGCIDCLNGDQANYDLCEAANACALENCESGVISVAICDSGLAYPDPAVGVCLNDNCCEEFTECTDGGDNVDACLECFNGDGGPLCDPATQCLEDNCNTGVCESGIGVGDVELAACLTEFCCTEYSDCTADGTDVDACLVCFNDDEGGPLCDEAIACGDLNCGGGEGGGGGAGPGVGGGGGAGGQGGN